MEPFSGDTEENTEDNTGRKNSKIKSLKTRFFRRSKKAGPESNPKLSQSASDIPVGKGLGSDEDLVNSQGMMGSRALSHDSIFLDDQVLTDAEPARVLSQENVHSKIKSLQMKLQLQKMHFGPPPLVLPVKSPEEPRSHSEEFLFFGSKDASGEETHTKTSPQTTSPPLSPPHKSTPTKLPHPNPFNSLPVPSTSTIESPLDFGSPAEFTASLDTSAARHRMSIKPRNQRASTKRKTSTAPQSVSTLHNLKNTEQLEFVEEKEQQIVAQEKETEEKEKADISQHLPVKSAEASPVTSEVAPKLSSQSVSQRDQETVVPQVLRVKPHRRVDSAPTKRPHSSFIESEIREKRETQTMSDKIPEQLSMFGSVLTSKTSSAQQQCHGKEDSRRQIKRPPPGAGSFHVSISAVKNQDGERPRSGSFGGRTEAKNKTTGGPEEKSVKEKEDFKSMQLKGSSFAVDRLRQEGSPSRGPANLWERKASIKKPESVTAARNVPSDTAAVEAEEMESSQELVDEAEEAKEEEGKTPFGIKLRSTSLSLKFRSESPSNRQSKTELSDDQNDKKKRQETGDNTSRMPEKLPTNVSCALGPKDPALSGAALPVKQNTSLPDNPPSVPTEAQTASSHNKEAETAPQTSSSEVSWMTLAMEKTRSLQQLFTSRFPRDSTGTQTSARPQAQVQSKTQTESVTQTQTVKVQQNANQPSMDTTKEESAQSKSQEQGVKPSAVAMQQKIILIESQMSKQPNEAQSQPNTAQPPQSISRTTQSPLRTSSQPTSQLSQGNASQPLVQSCVSSGQQQPSWTSRGLQPATQVKPTSSAQTSETAVTSVPASDSALEKGEKEGTVQQDSPSLFSRRTIWTGSVAERAAFLEKRAEWTTPPSLKGVEVKKAQTESQPSGDTPTLVKNSALSKDPTTEIRQVVKTAESSPIKVPEKSRDDKWLRKNVDSPSSPSSSHTRASVLSDSGQPSWMELAKRKSMAWSDKTMD